VGVDAAPPLTPGVDVAQHDRGLVDVDAQQPPGLGEPHRALAELVRRRRFHDGAH
jgi:hypothetical protein